MQLVPYLHFEGNAEDALNFYKDALGGEITMLSRYKDSPMPVDEDYKEKVIHARLKFGDNLIMISDTFKGNKTSTGGNIQMSLEVDDENKMEEVFSKLAEGGKVTMPLQKQFWGAKFGMLTDKFGTGWMLNHEGKND